MGLSPVERALLERRLRRRRRGATPFLGLLGILVLAAPLAGSALALAGAGVAYASLAGELEGEIQALDDLDQRELAETTRIYDRDGTLLRERLVEDQGRRTYVPLSEVPLVMRQATIAVEDSDFYQNPGIDVGGIARAMYGEVSGQPDLGGGSTITQQFVRHVAFSFEERTARSYERKLKEIVLALILTRQASKDQILEWYLNEIYYGNLAYGVEAAAQTIFDKSARDLSLAEAALLAGLPQLPGVYDPLDPDPEVQAKVKARQRTVLQLMADGGFIGQAEAEAAAEAPLTYKAPDEELFLAPHFVVWVEDWLEAKLGADRLARGGLAVTTTLDLDLQSLGEREVREQVEALRERHDMSNAALVALEPASGQVLAMVGSADYWDDGIDGRVNVAIRERQPGSSIKPVTYAAAIAEGMSPATVIWDVPMELWLPGGRLYEPQNYDERFHGPVRLRAALANSYNIPALKVLGLIPPKPGEEPGDPKTGIHQTVEMAHRMGLTGLQRDPWEYGLSLTLGGGEATLLDMTTVYATLANMGERVRPNPVLRVTDSSGEVLYDLAQDEAALAAERALDEGVAYIVTDMLADNAARTPAFGGSSALQIGVPAAAKTGTTNDYRDNWTLGYTPYLVTGVWAGNSDNRPMRRSSGLTGAAPIWSAFMRNVINDEELRATVREAREAFGKDFATRFERPEDVVQARVCRLGSLNTLASTCQAYDTELFLKDRLPPGAIPGGAEDPLVAPVLPPAVDPSGAAAAGGDQPGDSEAASVPVGDWRSVGAVVVPLPGPPEDVLRQAAERGEPPKWPTALLCLPGGQGFGADKAQPVAVLPLPVDVAGSLIGPEREHALAWARANGWVAIEPLEACTLPMVEAALASGTLPGFPGAPGAAEAILPLPGSAEYRLGLAPGSRISVRTVLTGTVVYDPNEIEYYKVELGPGRQPSEWITLGDVHRGTVQGGPIEVLDAASLAPGDYVVRLVLVKKDGNFLNPPHSVPISIGPAQGQ